MKTNIQENPPIKKKRSKWLRPLVGIAGVVVCAGAYVVVLNCFIDTPQRSLFECCEKGYYSTIDIQHGANPNERRGDGKTCLELALESRNPYVAALLLDDGAYIHDDELMLLCKFLSGDDSRKSRDERDNMRLLESLSKALNSVQYKGAGLKQTVLLALEKGDSSLLEVLCSSRYYTGEEYNRAVALAIDTNNIKLLKALASKVFSGKQFDKTLVARAFKQGRSEMAIELVINGASPEGYEKEILFRTIEKRPDLWVREQSLLQKAVHQYAGELLVHAAKCGQEEIVRCFLNPRHQCANMLVEFVEKAKGEKSELPPYPEIDLKTHGIDALFESIRSYRWSIAQLLLEAGVDVKSVSRDDEKKTLLHAYVECVGCEYNNDFVSYLLQKGADVNAKDASGLTALHFVLARYGVASRGENRAEVENLPSVAALLIQNGADVRSRTDSGLTPLMIAAWVGAYEDVFHLMLQKGAEVNTCDKHGFTALMWATVNGQYDSMQALLAANADVNAATPTGATALSFALQKYDAEAVRILLAAGAATDASTIDTAAREAAILQLSRENNDRDILNLLRKMPGLNINYMLKKHRFPSEKEAMKRGES